MFFVRIGNENATALYNSLDNVKQIYKLMNLCEYDNYITLNGAYIDVEDAILENSTYDVCQRIRGGKGGFGSMLRAIGAQIEKTTNHEACRDLSGRRMRDVNNEKQLRDWVSKAAERETIRRRKRKERHDKRHAKPSHNFDNDGEYSAQKSAVTEQLHMALEEGLKKASNTQEPIVDENITNETSHSQRIKRACHWLGLDTADLSDLSSESETDEDEVPAKSVKFTLPPPCDVPKSNSKEEAGLSELGSTIAEVGTDSIPGDVSSVDANSTVNDMSMIVECSYTGSVDDLSSMATGDNTLDDSKIEDDSDLINIEIKILTENDLLTIKEPKDLQCFGLDALKNYLQSRGLKCGGTLDERCERIFQVKDLKKEDIDSSFLAGKQRIRPNK